MMIGLTNILQSIANAGQSFASGSNNPIANIIASATDPSSGTIDTKALSKIVADAAKVDLPAANIAYSQIEQLLNIGDASRFAQDVRAANAANNNNAPTTRGQKLEKVVAKLPVDSGTKASIISMGARAQELASKYNREIGYAVFKHDEKNEFQVRTALGYIDKNSRPVVELDLKPPAGYTLTASGHAHNWSIGGMSANMFGGGPNDKYSEAGPSPDDVAIADKHPDVIFLLHQKRFGTGWETISYGRQ